MKFTGVITEVVYKKQKVKKSDYDLDLWKEVRKRWLVFGVLISIMFAVVSPHVGAPGGPLHMEYISYAPLTYIYFNAGRGYRRGKSARVMNKTASVSGGTATVSGGTASILGGTARVKSHARVIATSVLHANVAAPVLCVVTVSAFQDVLDHRIIKGALFASVGGPCPWLSLSLSQSSSAVVCVASSYVLSLLAAPLAMLLLCGRAAVPPIGHLTTSVLTSLIPFTLGTLHPATPTRASPQLAALLLLYGDVCARLVEAEGSVYVGDVLTTICLELCYLWSSAALCCAYARCGLLSPRAARTVAFCALPKADHHGWEWSPMCGAWGAGALAGVLRAPAAALLLAAAAGDGDGDGDGDHA
ncbi:sodium/bile acid cotransporter 7-like isoform X2 [Plodia interpunctella]|uniref:sodium/bile acid cotransporter 7-like isoform X2 n=1 Tax=Plodia interpunctella TaxID=58824 RepID=UPI002367FDC4|nr:sodium/bile acid cotransporter 7-like isoform X2 [Plodia interpunctella]